MSDTDTTLQGNVTRLYILIPLIAAIAAAPFLVWHMLLPPTEKIHHPAQAVNEVTLEHQGYPDPFQYKAALPILSIGYVKWAAFDVIHYQGWTFTHYGADSYIVRPWDGVPSRYILSESLSRKNPGFFWSHRTDLQVRDAREGKVLAEKIWWRNGDNTFSADHWQGWQGQFAAQFARRVLQPTSGLGGAIGVKPYPPTRFSVEGNTPTQPVAWDELQKKVVGCKEGYRLAQHPAEYRIGAQTPHWWFLAQNHAQQLFCTPQGIFIVSFTYPDDLFLNWLAYDGKLLGQFDVSQLGGKLNGYAFKQRTMQSLVKSITVADDAILLKRVFLAGWPKEGEKETPFAEIDYRIEISNPG